MAVRLPAVGVHVPKRWFLVLNSAHQRIASPPGILPSSYPHSSHYHCRPCASFPGYLPGRVRPLSLFVPIVLSFVHPTTRRVLLIRKLQCTGTSVVSGTDCGVSVSVTICSLLGFLVEERSPLRPPFIPSFNILLLLMAMLF